MAQHLDWRLLALIVAGAVATSACSNADRARAREPERSSGTDTSVTLPASQPAPPFVVLAAGRDLTCGIATPGALYCWGRNDLGQVGDGTNTDRALPVRVGVGVTWEMVAPGGAHSCGITDKGSVFCWGSGLNGELGNDSIGESTTPLRVTGVPALNKIVSGENHSCGLTLDGALWCWGENRHGELGRGDTLPAASPSPSAPLVRFRAVTLASHATCAVTTDRRLFCWGLDNGGALGFTATHPCEEPSNTANWCAPVMRQVGDTLRFTAAALGYTHGCALTGEGDAYCWGSNGTGQLGIGSRDSAGPEPVSGDAHFAELVAGSGFTCGLAAAAGASGGDVQCWGSNDEGQLGNGGGADSPLPVPLASNSKFTAVTAGQNHACGLTTDHAALCWGANTYGQLGSAVRRRSFTPVAVAFPADQR